MACPWNPDILLRQRQSFAERHPQLPFDQIDPRDQFGHGMLDLQSCVHLDEEHILAVGHKFDGAGADVIDRRGGLARRSTHGLALCRTEGWRRRFLDHLLMPPLQRAFALEQRHQIAVAVADHLHFDVTRIINVFLNQHAIVAERGLRLALGADDGRRKFAGRPHDPHAAAATPGGRLDQHRKADSVGGRSQGRLVLRLAVITLHQRHAGLFHQGLGPGFRTHRDHHLGGGTDEHQSGIDASLRKFGIFRQEPITRVHGFGAALSRRFDHTLDIEIAVTRPRRPEQHGLIGFGDMHRSTVRFGVDRDRAQAHGPRRADHAAGDLAAVGDQEGVKSPVGRGTNHHHILNRPNFVGSIGALAAAESPRPSTSLVSAGSITPSSQSRAVA